MKTSLCIGMLLAIASGASAVPGDIQATVTPAIIKQAEGISPEPAVTPAPGMSPEAPANFDPSRFGKLTTETLPMEQGEPVVMRVNGRPVTWQDFLVQARMTGAELLLAHPGQEEGIYAALAQPVMDVLLVQELYREFADTHSIPVHPSEINKNSDEILKSTHPTMRALASLLGEESVRQLVRDNLVREKVTKFIGDRATSTPPLLAELTSFTEELKPTTAPVQLTRASHIVIRATPDMSEFNINDAKARAEEILEKIRGGMDFTTAARQYSLDRFTAYINGNVGYFTPGMMYQAFDQAAAKLQPGEISEVIRSPVGFHIIQVTERHNDDLRLQYDEYRKLLANKQWLQQAQGSAKVEKYLGK